jgi:hypothetical protein
VPIWELAKPAFAHRSPNVFGDFLDDRANDRLLESRIDCGPFLLIEELAFDGAIDVFISAAVPLDLDELDQANFPKHADVVGDEIEMDVAHPALHPSRAAGSLAEDVEDVRAGGVRLGLKQPLVKQLWAVWSCQILRLQKFRLVDQPKLFQIPTWNFQFPLSDAERDSGDIAHLSRPAS